MNKIIKLKKLKYYFLAALVIVGLDVILMLHMHQYLIEKSKEYYKEKSPLYINVEERSKPKIVDYLED